MAQAILDDWEERLTHFWQVIPPAEDKTVYTHTEAELNAFETKVETPAAREAAAEPVVMKMEPTTIDPNYWNKQMGSM